MTRLIGNFTVLSAAVFLMAAGPPKECSDWDAGREACREWHIKATEPPDTSHPVIDAAEATYRRLLSEGAGTAEARASAHEPIAPPAVTPLLGTKK